MNCLLLLHFAYRFLAERVGFEPTEPVKAHSISNAANSTTLAPFRNQLAVSSWPLAVIETAYCQQQTAYWSMAERVGFEPTVPAKVQQFSRLPDSTTLAPLRVS